MGENSVAESLSVKDEPFYHGYMAREDVQELLQNDGDFVVRIAEGKDKQFHVVSVLWDGEAKHFAIQMTREGRFYLDRGMCFESIGQMIKTYERRKSPLTARSGAKLLNRILRQPWELGHEQIVKKGKIRNGTFGGVYEGILKDETDSKKVLIEIKTCQDNTQLIRQTFMREARRIRGYSHPNIIRFYGVQTEKFPLMLVFEYVPEGSLLSYLKAKKEKKKEVSEKEKINFCLDTAKGMEYLQSQGCIHQNLSATNCYIIVPENQLKIAEYAPNLDPHICNLKKEVKKSPTLRWLPPETLAECTYTAKADAWSYGVVMWEIFSNGSIPYSGMTNKEVHKEVSSGKCRLNCPEGTPSPIAQIMKHCWEQTPEQRPNFATIRKELESLTEKY